MVVGTGDNFASNGAHVVPFCCGVADLCLAPNVAAVSLCRNNVYYVIFMPRQSKYYIVFYFLICLKKARYCALPVGYFNHDK